VRGTTIPDNVIGSGIALRSVEQIVQQHAGTVHIESRLGSERMVSARLPCRQAAGSKAAP